jgi:hypothetical protein
VANTEENISPNVQQWIDNGGYAVTKDGTYVAVHNLHNTYVPASIIKIATTLAALEILGPAFRFETLQPWKFWGLHFVLRPLFFLIPGIISISRVWEIPFSFLRKLEQ